MELTTHSNTTAVRGKLRNFFLTVWEKWPDLKDLLVEEYKNEKVVYLLIGAEEKTEKEELHRHAILCYENPRSFAAIAKKFTPSHLEPLRSVKKAQIYSIKTGGSKYFEAGDAPRSLQIEFMTKEEIIREEPRCHRALLEAKAKLDGLRKFHEMLDEVRGGDVKKCKFIYLQGGSGKGKSKYAWKWATEHYKNDDISMGSFENGFLNSLDAGAKCIVVNEFRPSDCKASKFLEFTDRYGCLINMKGSFEFIRPEVIIVCSIKKCDKLYKEEIAKQFLRRADEIWDFGYDEEDVDEEGESLKSNVVSI